MAGSIDTESHSAPPTTSQSLPILGQLHEWVVTVDHKRLGMMYIGGGLFFFVIAGLQAVTIRLQLAVPERRHRTAAGIQPPADDARHGDGVPGRDADPDRLLQLPGAADDRRARPGVPAPQRFRLLAVVLRRAATVLQLYRRRRPLRRGQRARRRMVRVCTADRDAVLARQQY